MSPGGLIQNRTIYQAVTRCFHCKELTNHEVVGYLHEDGVRFMAPSVFHDWKKLRAGPGEAEQYKPVIRPL